LFEHVARRPTSRAACTAGSSSAANRPMIAITVSNSVSVKAALIGPPGDTLAAGICNSGSSMRRDRQTNAHRRLIITLPVQHARSPAKLFGKTA
jgi:hypothetical protein